MMGWLFTRERIYTPGRVRVIFLLTAILAFFLTETGRFVYRPYVRRHHIFDYGLADSIGNLGGILVQIFLTLAWLNSTKKQSFRIAPILALGYIAYEFLQPVLPKGVFDWKDVYGTLLGLFVAFILLLIIWSCFKREDAEEQNSHKEKGDAGI